MSEVAKRGLSRRSRAQSKIRFDKVSEPTLGALKTRTRSIGFARHQLQSLFVRSDLRRYGGADGGNAFSWRCAQQMGVDGKWSATMAALGGTWEVGLDLKVDGDELTGVFVM